MGLTELLNRLRGRMPEQRCKSCKQPVGQFHKTVCAKYYGIVLGGQDLEPGDTPEQRFMSRLTDEDRDLLKRMHISVEEK